MTISSVHFTIENRTELNFGEELLNVLSKLWGHSLVSSPYFFCFYAIYVKDHKLRHLQGPNI